MTNTATSVLIVEDELIVARDLQETLAGLGYNAVAIASSSDEALARATERRPDVALMDIRIKGKRDGIETAEILRRHFGIPIVYLTAHADEATIDRAKKTEPQGYLLKPVKSGELRGSIEVAVHKAEMERRLRDSERWFSTTLQSISDAVIAVDLASKVTFMNPTAETLTGTKIAEARGRPVREVLRLVDLRNEAASAPDTPLGTALREGRPVVLREALLTNAATGAQYVISDSASPVVNEGQPLGAVMVFRDVTEERRIQKQLELADRLSSLGTMAAGVAHEVNNPLLMVLGYSTLLPKEITKHREDLADRGIDLGREGERRLEEIRQSLGDLSTAAERIAHIVSDLRAFSRPPEQVSGRGDVVKAAQWAIRTTAYEFRYRARLVTALDPVPAVLGDDTRLGQVFINLLMNAAHAIAPGNIAANEVRLSTRTDERGRAVIEVRDTGTGIPEEARERIFEPFFTTKPQGSGTGLGLSICHGIVSSLDGEIQVESLLERGTTFRVILPAAPDDSVPPPLPEVASAQPRRRGRILVVDDERMMLSLIRRVLNDHELVCAESAAAALSLLMSGERFDLILLDLMMPVTTGMAFYEEVLRRFPDLVRSITFLSGGAVTPQLDAFLQSVPNVRIQKPFEVGAFRDTIQRLLAEGSHV